jgi:hypothetical protein
MNALDRVREKFKTPLPGTSKSSKSGSAGSAGSAGSSSRPIDLESTPSAGFAGCLNEYAKFVEAGSVSNLSAKQEAARAEVLAQLAANPTVRRAFTTRFEYGLLVVTLAVRGIGTCELVVPADRFDSSKPGDYAALLKCMEGSS